MEGNSTAGSEGTIKSVRGVSEQIAALVGNVMVGGISAVAKQILSAVIPITKANLLVRVYGNQQSTRAGLAAIAAAVAIDRSRGNAMVGAYLTQHLNNKEAPWVELRTEFFPAVLPTVTAIFNPSNFAEFQRLTDNVAYNRVAPDPTLGPSIDFTTINRFRPGFPNPPQIGRGGTAGTYVGALAVQTFAGAGAVPVSVPGNLQSINLNPV